jgi:hypothetical protein
MQLLTNDNEPYLRGRSDYAQDIPRYQNPYEDSTDYYGTTFWEAWLEGWDDADLEKMSLKST